MWASELLKGPDRDSRRSQGPKNWLAALSSLWKNHTVHAFSVNLGQYKGHTLAIHCLIYHCQADDIYQSRQKNKKFRCSFPTEQQLHFIKLQNIYTVYIWCQRGLCNLKDRMNRLGCLFVFWNVSFPYEVISKSAEIVRSFVVLVWINTNLCVVFTHAHFYLLYANVLWRHFKWSLGS